MPRLRPKALGALPTCTGEAVPVVRLSFDASSCRPVDREKLSEPASIAAWVDRHYGCRPQEHALVLHFNPAMRLLAVHETHIGGFAATVVDPRVVFSAAILSAAQSIVFVHTHPSGDPFPSADDERVTAMLAKGAEVLRIRFLDHIVVARGGAYFSFSGNGQMPRSGLGDLLLVPPGRTEYHAR